MGPRDGLQNEKKAITLATKLELIDRLARTGIRTIEAGSFVSPKWVPQMANSSEILQRILHKPPESLDSIVYQFLVPNAKGADNFFSVFRNPSFVKSSYEPLTPPPSPILEQPIRPEVELSIFTAATEAFTQKNTNCSIAESLERFKPIFALGKENDIRVRAYISVALGCPYEGPNVDPHQVADLAVNLLEMGATEISVADTTGMGTAPKTRDLLETLLAAGVEPQDLALHFHDTYGQALVNTVVGLEAGVRTFDSAVGGLGGCPYSPGATGNVASEDMVHLFESLGLKTGIDIAKLAEVGDWISKEVGRANESRAGKATLARLRET
ncbi:Acyl-lipid (8-3)-desaturase [Venturia nashicola]|uniref:hydroxymethylglutaryl-CoA lyase n=1 Tax=Venturia nashicola TaxID=86259 RepID=A0A4Z1P5M4_9PEZI|nr:Acyl-lipid (8-3)-desaturase [Venturia nashicola]TLD36768.1 Acyl-lipid (8-3)-desaturase [Venturia nashicola]